ncbi:hypothetical protein KC19_VG156700 [Ceratodon purpureus]|uniref:Uncharacterized protein n=1 Tax=Ceratodon purpureus TaxID=3225 RepID=A0A8T0HR34_CERPU|nr:hypothetical protein KC19_VG156700 [Ceratodon purpureus]
MMRLWPKCPSCMRRGRKHTGMQMPWCLFKVLTYTFSLSLFNKLLCIFLSMSGYHRPYTLLECLCPLLVCLVWDTALPAQLGFKSPSEITPTMTALKVGSFVLAHVCGPFTYVSVKLEFGS